MEVRTSRCQECQVAAMWRCIFFAALRRAQTPRIRKFFRPSFKRRIDGELHKTRQGLKLRGFMCHTDVTETLNGLECALGTLDKKSSGNDKRLIGADLLLS